MTGDEFRGLLARDREAGLRECVTAWLDANNEDQDDLISSLTSIAMASTRVKTGLPHLVFGHYDEEILDTYNQIVGNFDRDDDVENCEEGGEV